MKHAPFAEGRSSAGPDEAKATVGLALALTASDESSVRRIDRVAFAEHVRRLSVLRPWRTLGDIAAQWLVIVVVAAFALWLDVWYCYLAAGLVVATRQHALGVLMHEATHYRLHPHRWWNDFLSDLLCALPIGVCTSVYRHYHFLHHRHVNTAADPDWTSAHGHPDWTWPKPVLGCLGVFVRDLFGINFRMIIGYIMLWSPYPRLLGPARGAQATAPKLSVRERVTTVAFVIGLVVGLYVTGGWRAYLLLWLMPQLTALTAIFRLRALAEHYCLPHTDELSHSRTVRAGAVERFVISPCHINYHLEHHLFPSVPYYNLPEVHRLLAESRVPVDHAAVSDGYVFGRNTVLATLTSRRRPPPEAAEPFSRPTSQVKTKKE